jgi:hypothetical protein
MNLIFSVPDITLVSDNGSLAHCSGASSERRKRSFRRHACGSREKPLQSLRARLATLLGAIVIAAAQQAGAQSACQGSGGPGGVGCSVEYKTRLAGWKKCGFRQLPDTAPDSPRFHYYHQQVTSEAYSLHYHDSWTTTDTYSVDIECDVEASAYDEYHPGAFHAYWDEDRSATHTEQMPGPECGPYADSYTGSWALTWDNADGRHHYHVGCDGSTACTDYTDDYGNRAATAEQMLHDGITKWWWYAPGYHTLTITENCSPPSSTNDATIAWFGNIGAPDFGGTPTNMTLTKAGSTVYNDPNGEHTATGGFTVEVSGEYSDAELAGHIMELMPDYQTDYYTPSADNFDLFSMIAFSLIDGTHCDAQCWPIVGHVAQLQQLRYRFALSSSDANTRYRVSWEVIEWDTVTGAVRVIPMHYDMAGSGDLSQPAHTPDFEAGPPRWDDSYQVCGGYVIMWVDNVQTAVIPALNATTSGAGAGLPGSGPYPSEQGAGCANCGSGGQWALNGGRGGLAAEFSLGHSTPPNSPSASCAFRRLRQTRALRPPLR